MARPTAIRTLLFISILIVLAGCRSRTEMITQFEPAETDHEQLRSMLVDSDLSSLVQRVSESFKLKETVFVCFREDPNGPRYEDNQIIMPYEFLAQTRAELKDEDYKLSTSQLDRIVLSQAKFVLLHEIGHALIDQLALPVVGKEEDAVDGLATLLAVGVLESPEIALCAAVALDVSEDPERDYMQQDFWNEHSLNAQRYYNILCWTHGGAPDWSTEIERLAPEGWLEAKGDDCSAEYEKLARNWKKLLKRHLKPGVVIREKIKRG